MEETIRISNLNDFIFCPRSIYFHNIYSSFDESTYQTTFQVGGRNVHESTDSGRYSSRSNLLQGMPVYSEEFGLSGKIDLFDRKKGILIERKKKIKRIYDGYRLQLYAQYFCLTEMGYSVRRMFLHSVSDNKKYEVSIPSVKEKENLKSIVLQMRHFSLSEPFSQNPRKCEMCIYNELCDVYKK